MFLRELCPLTTFGGQKMRTFAAALALFVSLIPSVAFAQTGNASVGGFVQDATQAVIPGVTVTATNTQTGELVAVDPSLVETIEEVEGSAENRSDVWLRFMETRPYRFIL